MNEVTIKFKDLCSDELASATPQSLAAYGQLEGRRAAKLALAGTVGFFVALLLLDVVTAVREGGVAPLQAAKWLRGDAILALEAGVITGITYGLSAASLAISAFVGRLLTCCCRPICSLATKHKIIVALAILTTAPIYTFFTGSVFGAFVTIPETICLTASTFAVSALTYRYLNAAPKPDLRLPY